MNFSTIEVRVIKQRNVVVNVYFRCESQFFLYLTLKIANFVMCSQPSLPCQAAFLYTSFILINSAGLPQSVIKISLIHQDHGKLPTL